MARRDNKRDAFAKRERERIVKSRRDAKQASKQETAREVHDAASTFTPGNHEATTAASRDDGT